VRPKDVYLKQKLAKSKKPHTGKSNIGLEPKKEKSYWANVTVTVLEFRPR
jgi:hypothetical protein